jgi:lysyl-tRNA synthetase class 2
MDECEDLMSFTARAVDAWPAIHFRGCEIDLLSPWERISVKEAFQRYTRISMTEALNKDLFDEVMVQEIEPKLGIKKPTFLYDYPAERGALARLKKGELSVAERFEFYMGGLELANGFTELVDSEEQRRRFHSENENRKSASRPIYAMPEKFLAELDEMPPSAGIAVGVDRLAMVLLDSETIDEVVAFTPEEL